MMRSNLMRSNLMTWLMHSICFGLVRSVSGFIVGAFLLSGLVAAQEVSVVAEGAKPKLLIDSCKFTEGPAVDSKGVVYFTDQPNDRIMQVDLEGNVTEFLRPAGRSNGMFFAADGKLIACSDEKNEMWEIDSEGKHRVLFGEYKGKPFNGPNDVWVHPEGRMYFTDPYYQRPWWKHTEPPQEKKGVYSAARDGSDIRLLDDTFKQPNGIVGDAKRGLLYVADIGAKRTYRFTIGAGGELTDRQLFCEEGSDGMTLDDEGNVYLTGRGVIVYGKDGKLRERIDIPEGWTANVCFGGADLKTLYITASDSLYTLPMRVSGIR